MRKKYLSALLFGALLVTSAGTFTSCKDYDDEINNLQEQVDKLATKEDMEAKLSQMQTAIDAAKKTAEEALAKAEQGGEGGEGVNQEEIDKLKERIADLEEAMKKVETLKAEIKTMVDDELADFREEMKEFMKEVEELTGYSLTMITEISFVDPNSQNNNTNKDLEPALDVNYARVASISYPKDLVYGEEVKTADSYVFGEGMTGAITVNKGDVNTVKDEMLVKVAPVDAVISSDMLSLINGKGEDLNSYVNMSVESWSNNITSTRAASKTGLYKVGVQLKNDVDFEAFDNMVLPTDGVHVPNGNCNHAYNMFALAISDAEKSRTVTSEYEVSLHVQQEGEVTSVYSSQLSGGPETKTLEALVTLAGGGNNGATLSNDYGAYQVENGKEFKLTVKSQNNTTARVMASYVVVDSENPNRGLSATDKAAIKGMDIKGVNNVITSDTHKLTVTGEAGVAVPMKLVTIDYWGTVNVAYFWVSPATPAVMTVAYTVTPTEYTATGKWTLSKDDMQEFKIPAGADASKSYLNITAGDVYAKDNNNNETSDINKFEGLKLSDFILYDANKNITSDITKVAYAVLNKELNLKAMREDKTYSGEFKFFDANGNYLGSNAIKITKKLPTDVPAGFSAKTNTIVNGVMTIYPEPLTTKLGRYYLSESFNNWVDETYDGTVTPDDEFKGFGLTIKGITDTMYDNTNYWGYYFETSDLGYLPLVNNIHPNKIGEDDATYPATVKYNYGDIKYVPVGHGVEGAANYTVDWSTKFDFRFGHWIKDSKFQWTTAENPVVTYGEENIIYGNVTKTTGTDGTEKVTAVENVIEVIAPNGSEINPFNNVATNKWLTYADAFGNSTGDQKVTIELKTVGEDGTERTNEFFTAKFNVDTYTGFNAPMTTIKLTPVKVSEGTTVGNDVETKVYFKFTDKFGVDHNIHALTFTMKYKKN